MAKKTPTAAQRLASFHALSVEDLSFALKYLAHWGYLDKTQVDEVAVEDAAMKFQAAAEIQVDGLIGQQTLEAMWAPRCGCRDDALTQNARWRKKNLKLWVEKYLEGVPGLSIQDQQDLQDLGMRHFMETVDVTWSRATKKQEADLVLAVGSGSADQFDGPGGVLAWCQIPPGDDRQILMKFDSGDNWIRSSEAGRRGILYQNVFNHEFGHGHGMLHITDGNKALLNPIYDPGTPWLLDADKKSLYALGYAKATASPATPTPASPGGGGQNPKRTILTLVISGDVVDAAIPGYKRA